MSNIFLSEGTFNLSSGTANIIGSNIGATNLLSGSTVKVNSNKQLYSTALSMTDVQGLTTALGGRLSNPSSVPIIGPSFVKSGGTSSQYLMADGSVTTGGIGATGPTGATGATGPAGLSSSVFVYTFSDQVSGTPASGHLFTNNASPPEVTSLVVNHFDKDAHDIDQLLNNVSIGSVLIVQKANNSNIYERYQATSKTVSVGYVTYGIGYLDHSGTIANNDEVLLITQAQGIQGIQGVTGPTGADGPAGPAGSTETLEYTFAQANYYGTVPTFNLLNMAAGAVAHAGGSLTIGDNTGVSQLTKTYHVRSNPSATSNGAVSGWNGTTTGYKTYIGQGFKYTYSFGLLDTSPNAATRTMIGLSNGSAVNTLNATATVASITTQFIGIMQEAGDSNFSFYTRGSSSNTTVDSGILCTTPTTAWYTLTIHNNVNSANVILTLTRAVVGSVTTATQTFICGNTNSISTSNASYVLIQRNMASASGTTGSSILALGGIKLYFR